MDGHRNVGQRSVKNWVSSSMGSYATQGHKVHVLFRTPFTLLSQLATLHTAASNFEQIKMQQLVFHNVHKTNLMKIQHKILYD